MSRRSLATALELDRAASGTHGLLTVHARYEEQELPGRLAPQLTGQVWTIYQEMRRTAARWPRTFISPWLASVAAPDEGGGVPAPLIARPAAGALLRARRAAFGAAR